MEWENKVASMHGMEMAFPFLDRDLLSFLMAIPGEVLMPNGIPKGLLRAAMDGVLPEAILLRRGKADFTHLVNEAVEHDLPWIVQTVESEGEAVKRGYVSRDVLKKTLDRLEGRIQGATCEVAWTLSDLLGLELWLRAFFCSKGSGDVRDVEVQRKGKEKTLPRSPASGIRRFSRADTDGERGQKGRRRRVSKDKDRYRHRRVT
jgi:hypothetical protein